VVTLFDGEGITHSNPTRWTPEGSTVLLSTVGRGQEFVLDSGEYPEVLPWAASLLAMGAQPTAGSMG
jgi:hypothetical protein